MLYRFRKPLQYTLSILIAATLLFVGITFSHQQQRDPSTFPPTKAPSQAKAPTQAPAQMAIKEFQFTANQDGHTEMSIHADKMVVKKKKVGMLRFGLLKEAIFYNARIELDAHTSTALDVKPRLKQSAFKDAFKIDSIANLPMKNVAGIHLSPIDLRLKVDGLRKARITANRAAIKMPSGDIEFKGNVRWNQAQTTIESEYMVALLEKNTLLVPRKYSMNRGGEVTRGNNLQADLLLSGIANPRFATVKTSKNQRYWQADIIDRKDKPNAESR